jgi:hypothetical protein
MSQIKRIGIDTSKAVFTLHQGAGIPVRCCQSMSAPKAIPLQHGGKAVLYRS